MIDRLFLEKYWSITYSQCWAGGGATHTHTHTVYMCVCVSLSSDGVYERTGMLLVLVIFTQSHDGLELLMSTSSHTHTHTLTYTHCKNHENPSSAARRTFAQSRVSRRVYCVGRVETQQRIMGVRQTDAC